MLMANVVSASRQHKAEQNEHRLALGIDISNDLIVSRLNGNFVSESFLRQKFTGLITDVGMPYIRFHDLRHPHASILLELGEDLKVIQEQLGPANIGITADTYTHVSVNLRSRPATLLSAAFFGPKK